VAQDLPDSFCSEQRDRLLPVQAGPVPVELRQRQDLSSDLLDRALDQRRTDTQGSGHVQAGVRLVERDAAVGVQRVLVGVEGQ
jgi:hypothetical protein